MRDEPELPEIERLEEVEFIRILDHDPDAVASAIGPDAFTIKEYRDEWDQHVSDCADAIYDMDSRELGRLIMARALKYLHGIAQETVREET